MSLMQVTYLGELRTEAKHLKSGNIIITDAPVDNNGRGEAFSPTDLVCSSLGSCMMTLMGIKARKDNIDLKDIRAEVKKVMATNPRRISEIHIEFYFENMSVTSIEKEILKQAALTCPVALSLHPDIIQNVSFHF